MTRWRGLLALGLGLTLVALALAQGQGPQQKKDEPEILQPVPPLVGDLKKDEAKPAAKTKGEDPKEVMARIARNMESVDKLLKQKDTGKDTHELQGKILEDLDKLINQTQQQQDQQDQQSNCKNGQCKKPGGSKSQPNNQSGSQKPKDNQGGQSQQSQPKENKAGQGQQSQSKEEKSGQQNQPKENKTGQGEKNQPKENKTGQGEKNQPKENKTGTKDNSKKEKQPGTEKKEGQEKPGLAQKDDKNQKSKTGLVFGQKKDKAKTTRTEDSKTVGDIMQGPWGTLPPKAKQKLNAYIGDRPVPRYQELTSQYYIGTLPGNRSLPANKSGTGKGE